MMKILNIKYVSVMLLLIVGLGSIKATAQIIEFADPVFKNVLINHVPAVDRNEDGEIQISEAEQFKSTLNVISKSDVTALSGIEYFVNMPYLNLLNLNVLSVDLQKNTELITLDCSNSQFESVLLPATPTLKTVNCDYTNITSLNVSGLINLELRAIYANGAKSPFTQEIDVK